MMTQALVVEDDQAIRDVLVSALEDVGYAVTQAEDGEEALHVLQGCAEPYVVLLDLVMPRMSGIEVLQAVVTAAQAGAHDPDLTRHAYVLVTANRELLPAPLTRLMMPLSVAIVDKPFELDDLLDTVQTAARRVHLTAESGDIHN